MEIWSHGNHPRNRRMGQHPPRNVSSLRDSQFERHQPLAGRREMARPRLELLVRHVAVLFVRHLRRADSADGGWPTGTMQPWGRFCKIELGAGGALRLNRRSYSKDIISP